MVNLLSSINLGIVYAMDERRGSLRGRVLRGGKLVFNAGTSLVDCIIREQSERGAKLKVSAATALPTRFELLCPTENMLYPAQIVWRRGDHIGVAFVGPPRHKPPRNKVNALPAETLD